MQVSTGTTTSQPSYASSPSGRFGPAAGKEQQQQQPRRPKLRSKPKPYGQKSPKTVTPIPPPAPFASVPFTVSIVEDHHGKGHDDHDDHCDLHQSYHKDTTTTTTRVATGVATPAVVGTPSPATTATTTTRPTLRPCPVSSTSLSLSLSTTSRPEEIDDDDEDSLLDLVGGEGHDNDHQHLLHHPDPNNYLLPLALPSLEPERIPPVSISPDYNHDQFQPSTATTTTITTMKKLTSALSSPSSSSSSSLSEVIAEHVSSFHSTGLLAKSSSKQDASKTPRTSTATANMLMNNNSIIDDRTASPSSHVDLVFDFDVAYQDVDDDNDNDNSHAVPIVLADRKPKMVAWNKLLNCFFCTEPQPEHEQNNKVHQRGNRNSSNKTKKKCIQKGTNPDSSTNWEENGDSYHDKSKEEENVFRRSFGGALRGMMIRRHSSESLMMDPVLEIQEDNEDDYSSYCSNHQKELQSDDYDDDEQQQQVQHPHQQQQQQSPNQQFLYHNDLRFYHQQQQQQQILYQHQNPYQAVHTAALLQQGHYPPTPLQHLQNSFLYGQHSQQKQQQSQQQQFQNPHHYLHNDITKEGKYHQDAGDVCGTSVVSDFTESETSSYLSFSDDEEDDLVMGQGRKDLQQSDKKTDKRSRGVASGLTTNRQSAFRLPGSSNDRTGKSSDADGETDEENAQNMRESPMNSKDIPESKATNSTSAKTTNTGLSRPPKVSTRATTIAATASYDADTSALNLDKTITKPPILSSRSRSDNNGNKGAVNGLPPLMPSSSGQLDGHSLARSNSRRRCDTGDETFITRTSFTTTGSRHRRDKQFAFSDDSISEIWKDDWAASNDNTGSQRLSNVPPPPPPPLPRAVPPSYVTFQDTSKTHASRASYVSALAMSSSFGTGGRSFDSDLFEDDVKGEPNEDRRIHLIREDDSSSPFAELERKLVDDKNLSCHDDIQEDSDGNKTKTHSSPILSDGKDHNRLSRYLRKNIALDETTEGQVVISGWLAVAFSDDSNFGSDPEEHVIPDRFPSSPDDIFYLRIVVMKDGRQAKLLLQRSSSGGEIEHSFTVHSSWICQSRDTTRSMGRCVLVRLTENDSTGETTSAQEARSTSTSSNTKSLVLLPVSLDSSFCNDDKALVSKKKFLKLRKNLFPTDRAGYAPDEQVDSAMHVIFTLDSLIKRYGIGSPLLGY